MISKSLLFYFYLLASNLSLAQSDTALIRDHFSELTGSYYHRNAKHPETLDTIATYIREQFERYADTTYYQVYYVNDIEYRNVICVFGSEHQETVVIGAHYDVCGEQDGADDNASGTVGLLELARMLHSHKLPFRIEMVAYTLEEPPYFRTQAMGSYIHAESLKHDHVTVMGMICLEMIAYFSDSINSQEYPIESLKKRFGTTGNYITLVNKIGKGQFCTHFSKVFNKEAGLPVVNFNGPQNMAGVDFSDHLNYWAMGYNALMITDTSFYRNRNYHESTDTVATLDIDRMALVIDAILNTLLNYK